MTGPAASRRDVLTVLTWFNGRLGDLREFFAELSERLEASPDVHVSEPYMSISATTMSLKGAVGRLLPTDAIRFAAWVLDAELTFTPEGHDVRVSTRLRFDAPFGVYDEGFHPRTSRTATALPLEEALAFLDTGLAEIRRMDIDFTPLDF